MSKRVTPLVEKKLYTPEDLYKKQLMFFGGDQMSAGKQFNTINGVPLSKPVVSQGGDEYTFLQPNFDNNIGWASNIGPSTGHMLNVNKAYDASNGREVLALKNSMNPNGADFSHPMAQALVRQLGAIKPNSKEVEVINQMVRSHKNADDVVGDYKNFAGFLSPNAEEQILKGIAGESSAGDLRKVMLKVARSAEARKVGFPIYEDMLDAMLIPEHRNMMTGQGGNVIFTPKYQDKLIATPQYEHGSYTHGIPRDPDGIVGGLEQTVPTRILAHKTFAGHLAKGRSPNAAASSMQKGQWSEEFDQESLDKAMAYLKERKRLLEQE